MEYNVTPNRFIGLGHQSNIKVIECQWKIVVFGARNYQSNEQRNTSDGESTPNIIGHQTNNQYGCAQ